MLNFDSYNNLAKMWADIFKHLDGRGESFVAALDDLKNILGIFFKDLDRGAGDELDHVLVVALVPRDDRKDDDERVLLSDEVDVGYRRVVQEGWVSVVTWEIMDALLEKNDERVWQGLETPSLLFKSQNLTTDHWLTNFKTSQRRKKRFQDITTWIESKAIADLS